MTCKVVRRALCGVAIILGEGIKCIDSEAFYGCSSLVKVSFPSTLEQISENAFEECTSLEKIEIPSSVTSIGDEVFLIAQI